MKKLFILIALFLLTLQGGCQEDKVFKEVVTFEKGFRFNTNGIVQTIPFTGQSSTVTWETLPGKPSTFPPSAHTHPYTDVIGTPQIDLQAAIGQMKYIELPQATTTEINALVIPAGKIVEIWDKTLKCKKVWDGAMWKVYITNQ